MHKAGEWRGLAAWTEAPTANADMKPITLPRWMPREPEVIACLDGSGQTAERECYSVDAECARLRQILSHAFNVQVGTGYQCTCTDRYLLQVAARIWQLQCHGPDGRYWADFSLLKRCQYRVPTQRSDDSTFFAYLVAYSKQLHAYTCWIAAWRDGRGNNGQTQITRASDGPQREFGG